MVQGLLTLQSRRGTGLDQFVPTGAANIFGANNNNESKPAPAFGPDIRAAIGRELRAMYAHIVAEGVPERFAAILRRLDHPSSEGRLDDTDTPPER